MRFRRLNTKMVSAAVAALILTVAAAQPAGAQQAIRLGTSAIGSSFYVVAVAMSRLIQKYAGINVAVEPLGGSHANIFGLGSNRVDFAMSNSGAAYDGYNTVPPFKKRVDLRLLMSGNPTLRWFMVRTGAGIRTPRDLVGKVMSTHRRPLPELQLITNAMFKVYDLPASKIKQVASVDAMELNRSFRSGAIDAATFPFSPHQPSSTKLFADGVIAPLILPEDKVDQIKALLPDKFSKFMVKANNFKNQPKAFWSLMMTVQLTTGAAMSEDEVYKVVKAILGHHAEFAKFHATARAWTVENTLADPKIPFHPGAIRYFKEIGKWTPRLEALQARLLKNG